MFFTLALRRDVALRAAKTALIVGCVLAAINHADALLANDLSPARWLKIVLTFAVPYCVSTYASVRALQSTVAAEDQREK